MEPKGNELILRYKGNYAIPPEAEVTEEMILHHWELEKALTQKLLASTPQERWEVFEQCYSTLFAELEWINRLSEQDVKRSRSQRYREWLEEIGSPPQKLYEIGSGKGDMITFLAESGLECKGTEVTRERGQKHVSDSLPNLSWGNSDGIHLDRFETLASYNVVLSHQVVEHFHPDDLIEHFQGCHSILVEGGRYIFSTPHRYTGPHDVSIVFKCDRPQGMHLKEYTYGELLQALKQAGFRDVYCSTPSIFRKLLAKIGIRDRQQVAKFGKFYLNWMLAVERILGSIGDRKLRRLLALGLRKVFIFRDNIFLVAQKRSGFKNVQ
jgi:cyclopropane fatty-acyl-phospholipid synthase-like methyltransferase